jgi:hypothetical protein
MNSAILTIVDDDQAERLMERLRQLDVDNPLLGLRAFMWNVEKSI